MRKQSLFLLFLFIASNVHAAPLPLSDEQAVQCLMGEARGESYTAIVAHAEALRNRYARYGRLWGVDGCKWRGAEPRRVWDKVRRAWLESASSDLVHGADHWYAEYIDAPGWTRPPAVMTAKYGKTKFYRGVK